MPFIRGQYHINSIAGEALEAAREAEAALLALQHDAAQASGENGDDGDADSAQDSGQGPIHRVEIEAAELVPSHSGRAQRGFVAHVHRDAIEPEQGGRGAGHTAAHGNAAEFGGDAPRAGQLPTRGYAPRPETHVFADHHDLVSFLRDEFAKSCGR
jgi:hypothetical protein